MSMRRNIISMLLWFGVAAIFTIHIILQHRKDLHQVEEFSEKQITQVKTTILKRTEMENIHQRKQKRGMSEEEEKTSSEVEKASSESEGAATTSEDSHDAHDTAAMVKREMNESRNNPAVERPLEKEAHAGGDNVKVVKEHDDGGSGMVGVQSLLDKAQEEIERLRTENKKLSEREHQFKRIARQLATKLRNSKDRYAIPKVDSRLPWIYAITPTYGRFTQKADLVRLIQTLLHITNFHWIVVEDSTSPTTLVSNLLKESGLSHTHLNVVTPTLMKKAPRWKRPHRGVAQRNHALQWLRDNVHAQKTPGVVYFMDDDNTYHRKIFDEMRYTQHVSIWGVGLAGGARWAGPIVKEGKVVSFHVYWAPQRSFPIDMCGFAINLRVLLNEKPGAEFDAHAKLGHLEPTFLEQLTTKEQLEPLADNCTKIYVWHTRTEVPKDSIRGERILIKEGRPNYPEIEV